MATWPAGLPAPQKNIGITPGDTRKERKLQSGRAEFRRFGDGKPDQTKMLFRLTWTEWDTFKTFYEYDLNLGLNWFSASWLTMLGYSEHKAKFLDYPREVARQGYYVDIVCTLIVQKTAWIIGEDTEWPCATTGGEPEAPSGYGYIYGGGTLSCDGFNPTLNTWTTKADMPSPVRWQLAASTIEDEGYIYGGNTESGGGGIIDDCDRYNPLDTWMSMTNIPLPARTVLAASTIGSSGYIYGGNPYPGGRLQDCDEYTPDVWVSKTDMPSPTRFALAASTIGSSGYVYGGFFSSHLRDCDEYTPDTWVNKNDMPVPARFLLAASTIGSSGYVYGGNNGSNHLQDCDEYTPNTWVSKADMLLPARCGMAASTIGNYGYIYGCGNRCDRFNPTLNTWTIKADIPSPGRWTPAASTI